MNKKANAFFGILTAIFIFMVGVLFVPPFQDTVTTSRTDLNCTNLTAISDGTKALCLVADFTIIYIIIAIISIAGGFIAAKIVS